MEINHNETDIDTLRRQIILHYYEVEGGSVTTDNPDDLGGATGNGGMTQMLMDEYKHLWDKHGFNGDVMGGIPYPLIEEVCTHRFWDRMWLNEIARYSPYLADTMYGWALNSGTGTVIKLLQMHLNGMNRKATLYPELNVDGGMGNNTFDAFEAYFNTRIKDHPMDKLLEVMLSGQTYHYCRITHERKSQNNDTFYGGWLNRIINKRSRLIKNITQ